MNTLVIKKEDLIYNIKQIKQLVEKLGKDDKGNFVKIIALIEENGYGLGLIEYVKILIENGISIFAIETIEEAIKLKKEKIKQDIVYIKPTAIKEDIQNLVENDIIITLGSKQDIENVNEIGKKLKKKIRAYLEIDTKVGTSGFMYNNREELIIALKFFYNDSKH